MPSRAEALRRAILASAKLPGQAVNDKLAALDRLQKSLGLTAAAADEWVKEVRAQRRAWTVPKR